MKTRGVMIAVGVVIVAAWLVLANSRIVHTPEMDTAQQLRVVAIALEEFRATNGRYPTQSEGLMVLVAPSPRGYLADDYSLRDAWHRLFVYRHDGRVGSPYVIYSYGPNGRDDLRKGDDIVSPLQAFETK